MSVITESKQTMLESDLLTRVGLKLGHYTDSQNLTGASVFIAEKGAHIGIDVRGSSPGSINTEIFGPKSTGKLAHAVLLTGGSLYGLEAAFGVMKCLEEKNIGLKVRSGIVPLITGAVIFDLAVGNGKVRPNKDNGYKAAQDASYDQYQQGNVGAGTGATTGKWSGGRHLKGGFGIGAASIDEILTVAFVATNAVGDVINPQNGQFYSECGKQCQVNEAYHPDLKSLNGLVSSDLVSPNTTIAVIATNLAMHKTQLMKVAELAHDGMARAIYPIHTTLDGDAIFALSSLNGERRKVSAMTEATCIDLVGLTACDALTKAINNSITNATSIDGFPAYNPK